jgi:hypothetical protein
VEGNSATFALQLFRVQTLPDLARRTHHPAHSNISAATISPIQEIAVPPVRGSVAGGWAAGGAWMVMMAPLGGSKIAPKKLALTVPAFPIAWGVLSGSLKRLASRRMLAGSVRRRSP